jgi:uncharacterized protein (TIGR02145 family)
MCGTAAYDPKAYLCKRGVLKPLCGAVTYEPETEACKDGVVKPLCGTAAYEPEIEVCVNGVVKPILKALCGAVVYNPEIEVCENGIVKSIFIDSRDGKKYKSVVIGTQTWMAENLNYAVDFDGILYKGSLCYGDNSGGDSQDKCGTYGRLYNWATAMALGPGCDSIVCSNQIQSPHQGICPDGWHLPSDAEWNVLYTYADKYGSNETRAGTRLKTVSGWDELNNNGFEFSNGSDLYGFSGLPSGASSDAILPDPSSPDGRVIVRVHFSNLTTHVYWWTATEANLGVAYSYVMNNKDPYLSKGYWNPKRSMQSVRCVKD